MAGDFLGDFIGNQNRAKLLRVFAINQPQSFTLLQVAKRCGVTTKTAMEEIKQLENASLIRKGKQKELAWSFNPGFKYAAALSKFVHEVTPMRYDNVILAIRRSGRPTAVILSGCFMGDPTRPTDIIIAADGLNQDKLEKVVSGLESVYGRELRYAAFSTPEFRYRLTVEDKLIRDTLDYPHLVLLDKTKML